MHKTMSTALQSYYDTIVIGGGPAGSTYATVMANAGRSVLVLEANKFPRFAVGEIVAPTALWRVWYRMGISQEHLDKKFIQKYNGAWESQDGTVFRFEQDVFPNDSHCRPFVYSFERAIYDEFLLSHARSYGATALERAFVKDVLYDGNGRVNGVRFQHEGLTHDTNCALLVDATGRANYLANKLQLRKELAELKSFACFAHYEGVKRNNGTSEGDVRIIFDKDMWFWWAPLKAPKASVGIVANREVYMDEYVQNPEMYFEKYIRTCNFIWDRVRKADRITGFGPPEGRANGKVMLSNYHAYAKELSGNGWAIIGDAAAFIDPIFSAGLYVAQSSAVGLADKVIAAMEDDCLSEERLRSYDDWYWREFADVFCYIQRFATDYFDPKFVNFYLRLGNRVRKVRQLFIDTFVAYDPDAIRAYGKLVAKYFKDSGGRSEMSDVRMAVHDRDLPLEHTGDLRVTADETVR